MAEGGNLAPLLFIAIGITIALVTWSKTGHELNGWVAIVGAILGVILYKIARHMSDR